jgi:saccharopine dehydrogenase-like NADP-dependent oxidoreductase
MRVVALGGSGRYFQPALEALAASDLVSEIVIAGRRLASAEATAARAGPKGRAVEVDARDEPALAALAATADLLINVTGPYFKTLLPALRAAIAGGAHYLDYSEDGATVEAALALDEAAKAAGVLALLGMGEAPGINNLVALEVCRRLDRAEALTFGWIEDVETIFGGAAESLAEIEASGRVSGALQAVLHYCSGQIKTYRDGAWVKVEAFQDEGHLPTPGGETATGYLFGTAEVITLPRYLPDLRSVTALAGVSPPPANELLRRQAARIGRGEVDEQRAAVEFFTALANEPERWLAGDRDPELRLNAVVAEGLKDGRRARCRATINWNLETLEAHEGIGTAAPLALAALDICAGRLPQRGVLPPEACYEPAPFLQRLKRDFNLFDPDREEILDSRLEWLE